MMLRSWQYQRQQEPSVTALIKYSLRDSASAWHLTASLWFIKTP